MHCHALRNHVMHSNYLMHLKLKQTISTYNLLFTCLAAPTINSLEKFNDMQPNTE